MTAPARPFVAIVGGSKVSSKIGVLEALLSKCNKLIIGCAHANTVIMASYYAAAFWQVVILHPVLLCAVNNHDGAFLGCRGGMVFTFLAARGLPVGASLVEADKVDTARQLEALVRHSCSKMLRACPRQGVGLQAVAHAFHLHLVACMLG